MHVRGGRVRSGLVKAALGIVALWSIEACHSTAAPSQSSSRLRIVFAGGESLQNVPLGDPKAASKASDVLPRGSSGALALLAMVVVIASAVYWGTRRPTPENPVNPGAFQVATLPASTAPEPSAPPDSPGQRAYEMGRRLTP